MTIFTDHDDSTRTVTTYDEAGVVTSTRPYTADENAAADAAVADASTLTDLTARVARIEQHLWPAPADPTTPDDPTVTDWTGVWPDGGLLRDGGTVWRNVSGVPLTTQPSGFPGVASQWQHLFVPVLTPQPEPPVPTVAYFVQPTGAHDAYAKGVRVRFDGKVYESRADNNAYSPSAYPPNWLLIA